MSRIRNEDRIAKAARIVRLRFYRKGYGSAYYAGARDALAEVREVYRVLDAEDQERFFAPATSFFLADGRA